MRVESRGGGSCGSPSGSFQRGWVGGGGFGFAGMGLWMFSITGSWFVSCFFRNKGLETACARLSVLVFTEGGDGGTIFGVDTAEVVQRTERVRYLDRGHLY